jgi:hypothetical protein
MVQQLLEGPVCSLAKLMTEKSGEYLKLFCEDVNRPFSEYAQTKVVQVGMQVSKDVENRDTKMEEELVNIANSRTFLSCARWLDEKVKARIENKPEDDEEFDEESMKKKIVQGAENLLYDFRHPIREWVTQQMTETINNDNSSALLLSSFKQIQNLNEQLMNRRSPSTTSSLVACLSLDLD